MQTFLEETIEELLKKHEDIAQLTIVLPSKRAGGFFKNYLRNQIAKTTFLPRIISIEEFVEILSDLRIIDNTQLLLKSYGAYKQTTSIKEKEDFESYASWIQTLLNDFNEIDRYLVDTDKFFHYLGSIKSLEHWSMNDQPTEFISNYLSFWNSLPEFYDRLRSSLLQEGVGYQGMVYRKAAEELEYYLSSHGDEPHVFIGFNALNTAEQTIIKELLETGNSEIYWDAESYFFEDRDHSASRFMKEYFKSWKYYSGTKPTLSANYRKPKIFHFIEVQKNIAQVKYAGQLLARMSQEELNETAVVLADENLLVPLIYSLPPQLKSVNITMGVSIRNFPASTFFLSLLQMHQKKSSQWYYKDVMRLLNNPIGSKLVHDARTIVSEISRQNYTYISLAQLVNLSDGNSEENLNLLFGEWGNDPSLAIKLSKKLLIQLKDLTRENPMERVTVFELYKVFDNIGVYAKDFAHLNSIRTVYSLLEEALSATTTDFKGDAYQGLQIMGVLETRVLDFKNIILLSVNEGFLPSGKSNASFLTYDLKKEYDLPLFTDKDAIYTYHFYRLLHRAENIWLLYNGSSEGLNVGEKSRFLLQLEIEKLENHKIIQETASPLISIYNTPAREISKTKTVLNRIQEIASKGFSPSALTAYIRNPMDFYLSRVLKINEAEEVEETVDFQTLGTIVHNCLQTFYEPLEGTILTKADLAVMKNRVHEEVTCEFEKTFMKGEFTKGKNLLIFEVAKRYVENLIQLDQTDLEHGHQIRILQIETNLKMSIPIEELSFPVAIQGTVDRVDERDGIVRIIDYKTGNVLQGDLEIIDWEELRADYKYSKAFQVLTYALMIHSQGTIKQSEAGIISFKNLNSGFLKFATKTSSRSARDHAVTEDILNIFKTELVKLIREICDPAIPFIEKEV